jgi:serine protease Do
MSLPFSRRSLLAASLLGFAAGTAGAADPVPSVIPVLTPSRRDAMVEVVERVKGAVVNIHSKRVNFGATDDPFRSLGGMQPQQVNGMGTGIVLDPRGYVVTNHHVVDDVQSLRVCLPDGTTLTAKVLATDKEADLALIKIDPPRPLTTVPLGTAAEPNIIGSTVDTGYRGALSLSTPPATMTIGPEPGAREMTPVNGLIK